MNRELVNIGDRRLSCYWRDGPGIPIVMLHGLCGGAIHFESAFHCSELHENKLLAIDLPGFGNSSGNNLREISGISKLLMCATERYIDEKPWIIAHSMSASIAVRMLEKSKGLTLLEGNLLPRHLEFSDKILSYTRKEYDDQYQRLRNIRATAMRFQTRLADKELLERYSATYVDCSSTTVWDMAKICNKDVKDGVPINLIGRWSGPINCLVGCDSSYVNTIDELVSQLPDMQIQKISMSGHYPMIDNPIDTWRYVCDQMRRHSVTS